MLENIFGLDWRSAKCFSILFLAYIWFSNSENLFLYKSILSCHSKTCFSDIYENDSCDSSTS